MTSPLYKSDKHYKSRFKILANLSSRLYNLIVAAYMSFEQYSTAVSYLETQTIEESVRIICKEINNAIGLSISF
jgi:hypothetical protein